MADHISDAGQDETLKDDTTFTLIRAALTTHARTATFACGGSVSLQAQSPSGFSEGKLQVRFGNSGEGVTFVVPDHSASSEEFQQLLKATQPATFARAGEEVLDEAYRKAGKLDRGAFATDFCPYASGIIDTVAQMLLPQMPHSKHFRSISAELYKLNVYSAPSGRFKAHVDTPRTESQLGSLVVVLPLDHEGGQLVVRNAGIASTFDASKSAAINTEPVIKWAAFYSDCEHEVLEVTSGHRVTLTYNLFVTRGTGHLAGNASALESTSLPLHSALKTALANPEWLPKGRVLAIWLTHSYAHTSKNDCFLPESLKGADMSLYETARALGLECQVVPVIPDKGYSYGYRTRTDVVSEEFSAIKTGEVYEGSAEECWGSSMTPDKYVWINPPSKALAEAQLAIVAFGNDLGSLSVSYSRAAMFIRVPARGARGDVSKNKESIVEELTKGDDSDEDYY